MSQIPANIVQISQGTSGDINPNPGNQTGNFAGSTTIGGHMYKIKLANEAVNGRDAWTFLLPIAPEKLTRTHSSVKQTFNIIQGGSVAVSTGRAPEVIQFDCLLPLCNPYIPQSMMAMEDGRRTPNPAVFLQAYDRTSLLSHLQDDIADRQHIWVESTDFDIYNWYFVDELVETYANMYGDITLSFTLLEYRPLKTESTRQLPIPPSQVAKDSPPGDSQTQTTTPEGGGYTKLTDGNTTTWQYAAEAYGNDNAQPGVEKINAANTAMLPDFPYYWQDDRGTNWRVQSTKLVEASVLGTWTSSKGLFKNTKEFTVPNRSPALSFPGSDNPLTFRYDMFTDKVQYQYLNDFHDTVTPGSYAGQLNGKGDPYWMCDPTEYNTALQDTKNLITTYGPGQYNIASQDDIATAENVGVYKTVAVPLSGFTEAIPAGYTITIPKWDD